MIDPPRAVRAMTRTRVKDDGSREKGERLCTDDDDGWGNSWSSRNLYNVGTADCSVSVRLLWRLKARIRCLKVWRCFEGVLFFIAVLNRAVILLWEDLGDNWIFYNIFNFKTIRNFYF